jgi:hypothetical protein
MSENNQKPNTNIPRKDSGKRDDEFNEFEEFNEEENVVYEKNEADWFKEKMKRREATKKVVGVGIGAVLLGYLAFRGCDDDEIDIDPNETETTLDAISLQQKEGWDAGHTGRTLNYTDAKEFNSLGNNEYKKFTEMDSLLEAWKPKNEKYLPFFVPTLIQVINNSNFKSTLRPVCNDSMTKSYSKGLGFKELIEKSKNFEKILMIVDLPGPNSVAFAAALADKCVPVVTFDNWPHPLGVVPAQLTLGSMVYYSEEVLNKSKDLKDNSPLLMVLDRNRFKTYINQDTEFDNRYMAKIPTQENLKSLGIESIMYIVENETQELDDLNDDFASFRNANINISLLDLANFKGEDNSSALAANSDKKPDSNSTNLPNSHYHSSAAPVYHYGGGMSYMPFFFMHYAMVTPMRTYRAVGTMPSSIRTNNYSPVRRETIFSSRSVNSASGFGKTRPTGFGSISTRMNKSTGRMTGIRTGNTGSFGRTSSFGRSS